MEIDIKRFSENVLLLLLLLFKSHSTGIYLTLLSSTLDEKKLVIVHLFTILGVSSGPYLAPL